MTTQLGAPAFRHSIPVWFAVALCTGGLFLNLLFAKPFVFRAALEGRNDFRALYVGATLVGHGNLYDAEKVLRAQRSLFGDGSSSPALLSTRLPFYYGLISPIALFPYQIAVWVWFAVNLMALIGFVFLFPFARPAELAMACCWSFPLLYNVLIGQDLPFLLLIAAGALRLFQQKRSFRAGLVFSLCLIKFNLFLLVPLVVLIKREWRMAAGLACGGGALLGACFAIAGSGWPPAYLAILKDPIIGPGPLVMPNLHGLSAAFGNSLAVEIVAAVLVTGVFLVVVHRSGFILGWAAAVVASLLVSHHAYLQDCSILIPALFVFLRASTGVPAYVSALALLLPFPYLFSLIDKGGITALFTAVPLVALAWYSARLQLSEQRSVRRGANAAT